MFKKSAGWFLLTALTVLSGCQTTEVLVSKGDAFPKMYAEKPTSILVVPAINNTTAADAAQLYATTIAKPLAESGYYVFSVPFAEQFLQREGIVDGEQVADVPLERFKQYFDADTVLFVTLNSWDTNYYITGGNVTVAAKLELKSTTTNQTLWQYDDVVVHDTSGNSNSGGLIGGIIAAALTTSLTSYTSVANIVNQRIVTSMPVGKYHERHNLDGKDDGVSATKANVSVSAASK